MSANNRLSTDVIEIQLLSFQFWLNVIRYFVGINYVWNFVWFFGGSSIKNNMKWLYFRKLNVNVHLINNDVFCCYCVWFFRFVCRRSVNFITRTENICYKSLLTSINSVRLVLPFYHSKKSVSLTSFKFGLSFVLRKLFTTHKLFCTVVCIYIYSIVLYTPYIYWQPQWMMEKANQLWRMFRMKNNGLWLWHSFFPSSFVGWSISCVIYRINISIQYKYTLTNNFRQWMKTN